MSQRPAACRHGRRMPPAPSISSTPTQQIRAVPPPHTPPRKAVKSARCGVVRVWCGRSVCARVQCVLARRKQGKKSSASRPSRLVYALVWKPHYAPLVATFPRPREFMPGLRRSSGSRNGIPLIEPYVLRAAFATLTNHRGGGRGNTTTRPWARGGDPDAGQPRGGAHAARWVRVKCVAPPCVGQRLCCPAQNLCTAAAARRQ